MCRSIGGLGGHSTGKEVAQCSCQYPHFFFRLVLKWWSTKTVFLSLHLCLFDLIARTLVKAAYSVTFDLLFF